MKVGPFAKGEKQCWEAGLWLILFNPQNKPPHLGLIHNGRYYSLAYGAFICGQQAESIYRGTVKKQIPLAFFELKVPGEQVADLLADIFDPVQKIEEQWTCFQPIKRVVEQSLSTSLKAEMVFELIPELMANKGIGRMVQWHLDPWLDAAGNFELSEYTKAEIYAVIENLNGVKS